MSTFEFWELEVPWVYFCPRCGAILNRDTAKELHSGLFFCSDCLEKERAITQSPVMQDGIGDPESPGKRAA